MRRNSQSGIALVITLILLSVITFMAVTFLVVSRREGTQVDTMTSQTLAKEAAESGLQQAMAQAIANMQATTNGLNFGLMVSTNWNMAFYSGTTNLTDVCYYDQFGKLLGTANMEKMLNNLLILPRPPVFITTNQATPYSDFRYYLDLNRNGMYDTNGLVAENPPVNPPNVYVGDPEWIGILNHPDWRYSPSNFFIGRYAFIALPIGNSLDINYIGNDAKLLGGTGIPAGSPWGPGTWDPNSYLRNQGVGSWELNLPAFLLRLNTNWYNSGVTGGNPYLYDTNTGIAARASTGRCFEDATAILQYRYAENNRNLRPFRILYNGSINAVQSFNQDFIDGYSHGPLMTGFSFSLALDPDISATTLPWCGDYSPNQYFSTQDLFNDVPYYQGLVNNQANSFSNFLYSIGQPPYASTNVHTATNSYNRYTFYRMLSQMSFGSASEPAQYPYGALSIATNTANPNYASVYANTPRMNLNYVNINGTSATNFIPWTPLQFFTNAADRMLRAYFPNPIGFTNGKPAYLSASYIPIYPTNYYTPAVHRVLQLAANIYDSVNVNTNSYDSFSPSGLYFPSVFQPYFIRQGGANSTNIYIAGYKEVTIVDTNVFTVPLDLRRGVSKWPIGVPEFVNVYGVPYVIGARKGWPAFNKFAADPVIHLSRKIQLIKPPGRTTTGWTTNVMYTLGITNVLGLECWYPSTNFYLTNRELTAYAIDDCSMMLTNDVGATPFYVTNFVGMYQVVLRNTWHGSPNLNGSAGASTASFIDPLVTNIIVSPECSLIPYPTAGSRLQLVPPALQPSTLPFASASVTIGGTNTLLYPHFGLMITNRVRLMIVDYTTPNQPRLVDYVELGGLGGMPGPDSTNIINNDLAVLDGGLTGSNTLYSFWGPNAAVDYANQISASEQYTVLPPKDVWDNVLLPPYGSILDEMKGFVYGFILTNNSATISNQVPLTASRTYEAMHTWCVNDPLVHYTLGDLSDGIQTNIITEWHGGSPLTNDAVVVPAFGRVSSLRYQPWNVFNQNLQDVKNTQMAYKDPLAVNNDAWQFPTNKFPNIGWLGRVHRGTPWQTVYLKSLTNSSNWVNWTGNSLLYTTNYLPVSFIMTNGVIPTNTTLISDASISQPTNDWLLMDLFTTAPNDNASRGQLSINQTGTAAWAAVLDGVLAIQNAGNNITSIAPSVIDPNSTNNVNGTNIVEYLANRINFVRSQPPYNGTFTSLGQILSVPELTVNSPYLNQSFPNSLSDDVVERIPQQIMSLLRLGSPRYVIFAYGQSLKPAPHSIVTSGPYFGMCTNYQITGEVATRAVVRFDNFPTPGHPASPKAVVESFNVLSPNQ